MGLGQRAITGVSSLGIVNDRGRFGFGTELPISTIDIAINDPSAVQNETYGITLRNTVVGSNNSTKTPPLIFQVTALDTSVIKQNTTNYKHEVTGITTAAINSNYTISYSINNTSYINFMTMNVTGSSSYNLQFLGSSTYPVYFGNSAGVGFSGTNSNATQVFRVGIASANQSILYRYTNGGSSVISNIFFGTSSSGNSSDLGYSFDGTNTTQKGFTFHFSNGTTFLAGAYAVLTNLVTTAGSEKADLSWYWNPGGTTPTLSMVMNDDLQLTGFLYRSASYLRVQTQFDKVANTTLGDITNLSATVKASGKYIFEAVLFYDADAVGGQKYAIGGTCTATSIIYSIESINNATNALVITSRQTALSGSSGQAGSTAGVCRISGVIVVNAAGTLTVQFAQNAANGTSSILVGSYFKIDRIS